MFKNAIIYQIMQAWQPDLQALEEALQKAVFQPCGPTQERALGWTAPRGLDHGALVESVGGQWIARCFSETKAVPAKILEQHVEKRCADIEREYGRKPGRKERKEIKDEARLTLLPQAFPKQNSTWVWIDPKARILLIDTSVQSRADDVTSLLVEHLEGFGLHLLDTKVSPQACMTDWLLEQEAPVNFSVDLDCELRLNNDGQATSVRYTQHALDTEEIRQHIQQGKLPVKVSLTWNDRVSFVLSEQLRLNKIKLLDVVFANDQDAGDGEDSFDVNAAIATGEISALLVDLTSALGGHHNG